MRKLSVRALLVAIVLGLPMFMHGGRLIFVPFYALVRWATNALYYHQPGIAPRSFGLLAVTIFWFLAVPLTVAAWFRLNDRLRDDVSLLPRRFSRIMLNVIMFFCSFIVLLFALGMSDGWGGPVIVWGSDMFSAQDPVGVVLKAAFVLALLEQVCYWLGKRLHGRLCKCL